MALDQACSTGSTCATGGPRPFFSKIILIIKFPLKSYKLIVKRKNAFKTFSRIKNIKKKIAKIGHILRSEHVKVERYVLLNFYKFLLKKLFFKVIRKVYA